MRDERFRPWGQSVPIYLSIILAIAFLLAEGYQFYVGNQPASVWSIFIAFGIFILGERLKALSDFYAQKEVERVRAKHLEDLKALFTSKIEVRRLGPPTEGLKWLIAALNSDAVFVRDTIFRVNANASYSIELHEEFQEALDHFLKKGFRYIVVGNPKGLEFGYIVVGGQNDQEFGAIRKHLDKLNFLVKVNPSNFPIINWMIITYPNNRKEVLFGWDYDRAHMSQVFISEDSSLVAHFEGLFASALENSAEWSPRDKVISGPVTR